jgi:DUF4097 and DUF4098 domain-containing protein YvlB
MTTRRIAYAVCALGLFVATAPPTSAQQDADQVTVSWSDPGRPGTVEISSLSGGMTVKGSDRKDVLIISRQRGGNRQPPPSTGGLKRLTQSGGFSVEEERNVLEVQSHSMSRTLDFEVHVPLRTNLKLSTTNNGVITVDNVEGDMELNNINGAIFMNGVGGSIVANTTNGAVKATMTRLTAAKAMAFTTLNGTVDVTLPAATKATFKLRSDMGDVFTDFDLQLTPVATPRSRDNRRDGNGRFEIEVNKAIQGTLNGGGPEIELRTFNGTVYLRKGQ